MDWDSARLLEKAQLYATYANESDRDSPLFGLWSSLYVELLCRAALAKIHPSLLADPTDGKNILYAFGVPFKGEPISIPAKTVYHRCQALVGGFDEQCQSHCMLMARARNAELHSAEAAFAPLRHNRWRAEHFRVTTILCKFLNVDILEFFEKQEIDDLAEQLVNNTKELEGRVKAKVDQFRGWFEKLSDAARIELRQKSEPETIALELEEVTLRTKCPACNSEAVAIGKKELSTKVVVKNDDLVKITTHRTEQFSCRVCKLDLSKDELVIAGLPASIQVSLNVDPIEHFGIDVKDYLDEDTIVRELEGRGYYFYEPDYGND